MEKWSIQRGILSLVPSSKHGKQTGMVYMTIKLVITSKMHPSHNSSPGQVSKSWGSRMSRPHHESGRWHVLLSSRSVRHKIRSFLWLTLLTMGFVRPVAYPIPDDGPVGVMLNKLNRHKFRPAHIHMIIKVRFISIINPGCWRLHCQAAGYENLTTALYLKNDKFLGSDAVFGVRSSLAVVNSYVSPLTHTIWQMSRI